MYLEIRKENNQRSKQCEGEIRWRERERESGTMEGIRKVDKNDPGDNSGTVRL